MIEINRKYGETRRFAELRLDRDLLNSLDVFSMDRPSSTSAVDHFMMVERSAKSASDYTEGLGLRLFGGARVSEIGAEDEDGISMPAPTIRPLFFEHAGDFPLGINIFNFFEERECQEIDERAREFTPEFIQPVFRWDDLEELVEDPSDIFIQPYLRFEDLKKQQRIYYL